MSLLLPDTIDFFTPGREVRIKRHGYQRHYEGWISRIIGGKVYVDVACGGRIDGELLPITADSMCFYIDGDYAVVATPDWEWDDIPHPQSDSWEFLRRFTSLDLSGLA